MRDEEQQHVRSPLETWGIRRLRALSVSAALLILAACGGSDPGSSGEAGQVAEQASDVTQDGVRKTGPNRYSVVVYSTQGIFDPDEIRVPEGSTVTFRLKSDDEMVHGLQIEGADVAILSSPPDDSEATYTFTEPGEYPFVCQIYCGGGHDIMRGKVIVEAVSRSGRVTGIRVRVDVPVR